MMSSVSKWLILVGLTSRTLLLTASPLEDANRAAAKNCLNGCSGHGLCLSDGTCNCAGDWVGEDCGFSLTLTSIDKEVQLQADELHRASFLDMVGETEGPAAPVIMRSDAAIASEGLVAPRAPALALFRAKRAARSAHAVADQLVHLALEENERDAARRVQRAIKSAHEHVQELDVGKSFLLSLAQRDKDKAQPKEETCSCGRHGRCDAGVSGCLCEAGWTGDSCDRQTCPGDCNGNGLCIEAKCVCTDNFAGEACEQRRCPGDCNGRGYCFEGRCQCAGDFGGEDCGSTVRSASMISLDIGRRDGWQVGSGSLELSTLRVSEKKTKSCAMNCNGHGTCSDGQCQCHSGYSGLACEATCMNACSGRGSCVQSACMCHAGFTGADCSQPCCNGHGNCLEEGGCACHEGWGGRMCEVSHQCRDPFCSGRGVCAEGICRCEAGYKGDACEIEPPPLVLPQWTAVTKTEEVAHSPGAGWLGSVAGPKVAQAEEKPLTLSQEVAPKELRTQHGDDRRLSMRARMNRLLGKSPVA